MLLKRYQIYSGDSMFWFVPTILLSDFFLHLIHHEPLTMPVNKGFHHKLIYGFLWWITVYLTNFLLLNLKFDLSFLPLETNALMNNSLFVSVCFSNCFMWILNVFFNEITGSSYFWYFLLNGPPERMCQPVIRARLYYSIDFYVFIPNLYSYLPIRAL